MTIRTLFGLFNLNRRGRTQTGLPNAFIGSFELRVNRIVGWVRDKYDSDVLDVQIEVLRGGVQIAACPAIMPPGQRRFEFNLPVEGLFTSAELVKEEVIVIARDREGNHAQIRLDGAAQIELIRDHLGAPAVSVFDLDFSIGGNARHFLGCGWSGTEADFTWTEDDDSFINFDTPTEPGVYALRMTAGAIVHIPAVPEQHLLVFINETQIAQIVYNQAHVQFHECKFTHEPFGNEVQTALRLHHPNAMRPSDFKPAGDGRRLAFNFKRISLTRLLPVT